MSDNIIITTADLAELASAADSIIGYAAADGYTAQMDQALNGEWPEGADPVQVCIDDMQCHLDTLGYGRRRDEIAGTYSITE